MDKYFANQPIQITIPVTSNEVTDVADVQLVTYAINKVAPTTAAITDDSFNPNTESNVVLVDISASPVTETSIFEVSYTLATATNNYTYTMQFIVSPSDVLAKGENSYQDYYTSILTAEGLAGVDAFKDASKADQMAALRHAYDVLNTMVYADKYAEYYNLADLDDTALDALDPDFLRALRIAQVIEANEMLDANSVHYKRQDGLMSETIGESSMMFRPGNINNYPITRRSMMFLRNYVLIRARLERAS